MAGNKYQIELDAALQAAARAAEHVLQLYHAFEAIPDARADITTQADRDAQEIILQHLRKQFPTDAFCAEEATPTLAASPRQGPRVWVVDPIDGTRGFAQKNGEFSIMIGLIEHDQVVVGVVLEPANQRLTYAVRGGGCWKKDGTGQAERCQVTENGDLSNLVLTQSRSKPGVVSKQAALLQPARIHETHSAGIKLARVARGEADLYVNHYPQFNDWDIAAGHVLVEEAGGHLVGLRGGPVTYGGGTADRHGMLASNHALFTSVQAALQGAF
ncbi:MAG: 3'(2'),5'-bisphosphate nucleotidase CysQ [Gemmataceae bacterium]